MAILADDIFAAPRRRYGSSTGLFRDAGLHLALFGGGLAAAVLGALTASIFGWRGATAALLCYGVIAVLTLAGLARYAHPARFGLANAITLARASLTALMFGVAGEWLFGGAALTDGMRWALAGAAALILTLDGLDGQAARRNGMASPFGAHFDMEADALFVLALALLVMAAGAVGPWMLACAGLHYVFLLAGRLDARLAMPLPPLRRRKAIYVAQAVAPIIALIPLCPPTLASALCSAAFALVLYSFGADCQWLLTRTRAALVSAPPRFDR